MKGGENTVKWIKGQRISWLGHLEIMEKDSMPKKIFTPACLKRSSLQNWKGRDVGEDPEKMERGSRKRSSKC
jgi:hypothetical protein